MSEEYVNGMDGVTFTYPFDYDNVERITKFSKDEVHDLVDKLILATEGSGLYPITLYDVLIDALDSCISQANICDVLDGKFRSLHGCDYIRVVSDYWDNLIYDLTPEEISDLGYCYGDLDDIAELSLCLLNIITVGLAFNLDYQERSLIKNFLMSTRDVFCEDVIMYKCKLYDECIAITCVVVNDIDHLDDPSDIDVSSYNSIVNNIARIKNNMNNSRLSRQY